MGYKNIKLGKKGTVLDVLAIVLVFGFVLALSSLITFKFYNDFYAQTYSQLNDTTSQQALDSIHNKEGMFDKIFLAYIVGLLIVGYVFAFLTRESPIFFWLNLLIVFVIIISGVALSNAYESIRTNAQLSATAASFPIQTFVFSNLPIILTVAVAGMFIVMYIMGGQQNEL